uniref:Uncharacterized protein n=1 Tax=Cacopsylla melanoneura TaxID=428564 RepID=A0A8D8WMV4_9HEMI
MQLQRPIYSRNYRFLNFFFFRLSALNTIMVTLVKKQPRFGSLGFPIQKSYFQPLVCLYQREYTNNKPSIIFYLPFSHFSLLLFYTRGSFPSYIIHGFYIIIFMMGFSNSRTLTDL